MLNFAFLLVDYSNSFVVVIWLCLFMYRVQVKSNQILFHNNNITFYISKQKEKYYYVVVT